MSVIAWDGKTLAADKQLTQGSTRRITTKIWKHGSVMIAGIGIMTDTLAVKDWLLSGGKPDDFPIPSDKDHPAGVYVINKNGSIGCYEGTPYPIILEDKKFADGSGGAYAAGAMSHGASAREAVEIACRHDIQCGMGIDVLTFS